MPGNLGMGVDLDRCRREQAECLEYIQTHSHAASCPAECELCGAARGLLDWVMEEYLIMKGVKADE